MSNETLYTRIKRATEAEKQNAVRGEARLESLTEERNRIFKEVSEVVGKEVTTVDELEAILETQNKEIHEMIDKAKVILDEEGVDY